MLEARALSVGYRGMAPVVTALELSIERGHMLGLVGPNGAGKTTLLETLAGLRPALSGEVRCDGVDVTRLDATQRRQRGISLVREARRIFPSLTVEENLLVGHRSSFADAPSRADALRVAYEMFPVLHERRALSGALLSGGEQQMLAIARATMVPVRVLLADEPFMGLSWLLTKTVGDALHVKRDEGVAMVVADESERSLLDLGVDRIISLS